MEQNTITFEKGTLVRFFSKDTRKLSTMKMTAHGLLEVSPPSKRFFATFEEARDSFGEAYHEFKAENPDDERNQKKTAAREAEKKVKDAFSIFAKVVEDIHRNFCIKSDEYTILRAWAAIEKPTQLPFQLEKEQQVYVKMENDAMVPLLYSPTLNKVILVSLDGPKDITNDHVMKKYLHHIWVKPHSRNLQLEKVDITLLHPKKDQKIVVLYCNVYQFHEVYKTLKVDFEKKGFFVRIYASKNIGNYLNLLTLHKSLSNLENIFRYVKHYSLDMLLKSVLTGTEYASVDKYIELSTA